MMQNAIVTGASGGIGKAVAIKLAEEGLNVVLAARRIEALTNVAETINKASKGKALVVQTDMTDRSQVEAMAQKAKETFGSIDVIVNNAGVMLSSKVSDGDVEAWEKMIDVNIKGLLYGTNSVLQDMIAQEKGHVINIASVSGLEVTKMSAVYSATKFAVRAISTGLEKELAHTGVRVTNISPGMVDTRLTERHMINRKPLEASDIANAVHYAISQPSYVNVNEITVRPV
ncbi:MAG TPA: SDR family oxidoreductase [Pseudogracilibacillus sp.]|nr:SDR family oxidoreductase [Pseudogracilibacillus sp.]